MANRVGIFGGSFNPPHLGHIAICDWLLAKELVDVVWAIPCFIHPFGKDLASFDDRYKMCLFAFQHLQPKVVVSKVEKNMGGVSHTVKTIKHIQDKYPQYAFSLVTGEDVTAQTEEWRDFEQIKLLVPIISIPRGPSSPIPDISATAVRERVSRGESFSELVPREVAVYIVTHQLYR